MAMLSSRPAVVMDYAESAISGVDNDGNTKGQWKGWGYLNFIASLVHVGEGVDVG